MAPKSVRDLQDRHDADGAHRSVVVSRRAHLPTLDVIALDAHLGSGFGVEHLHRILTSAAGRSVPSRTGHEALRL